MTLQFTDCRQVFTMHTIIYAGAPPPSLTWYSPAVAVASAPQLIQSPQPLASFPVFFPPQYFSTWSTCPTILMPGTASTTLSSFSVQVLLPPPPPYDPTDVHPTVMTVLQPPPPYDPATVTSPYNPTPPPSTDCTPYTPPPPYDPSSTPFMFPPVDSFSPPASPLPPPFGPEAPAPTPPPTHDSSSPLPFDPSSLPPICSCLPPTYFPPPLIDSSPPSFCNDERQTSYSSPPPDDFQVLLPPADSSFPENASLSPLCCGSKTRLHYARASCSNGALPASDQITIESTASLPTTTIAAACFNNCSNSSHPASTSPLVSVLARSHLLLSDAGHKKIVRVARVRFTALLARIHKHLVSQSVTWRHDDNRLWNAFSHYVRQNFYESYVNDFVSAVIRGDARCVGIPQSAAAATCTSSHCKQVCRHDFGATTVHSLRQLHVDHRFDVNDICAAWLGIITDTGSASCRSDSAHIEWDGAGLLNRELLCRLLFSFQPVAVAGELPLPALQFRCGTTRKEWVVNEYVQRGSCHTAAAAYKLPLPWSVLRLSPDN